ncbi:MAG: hypothetical protein JNL18_24110 [Planctomycetaceae bacterium]|nr:hypothetical protein [Planctomycetaceae bacterium]
MSSAQDTVEASSYANADMPSVFGSLSEAPVDDGNRNTEERFGHSENLDPTTVSENVPGLNSLSSLFKAGQLCLPEEAMYGLPGEIVKVFDPYTEADPAAVLLQLLCMVGNQLGPHVGMEQGNAHHPPRIFCLVVGASGKARKGTSLSCVRQLVSLSDPQYWKACVRHGLSTGEGVISAFVDQGDEPRLLVTETEFASVLERMKREGNVLSTVIRDSFDTGELATMTRNQAMRVENAHLSIIGHITASEVRKRMASVDLFNGFANRFIWILVKRSKQLPLGSVIPKPVMAHASQGLMAAIDRAKSIKSVAMDKSVEQRWSDIYATLSQEDENEIIDVVTSRGDVMTLWPAPQKLIHVL